MTADKPAYHHGDLRSALVDAGLAILAEGAAASALTLREAARRAGVSAMAPYRHFEDKDALLAAVATVGFERLAAAQREADSTPGPSEALKAQGLAYVAFACANPGLFRLMFGAGAPKKAGALAVAGKASFDLLATRVASVWPGPKAIDRVLAQWSLVHGLAMLAVDGQLDFFDDPPSILWDRVAAL